MKSLAGRDNPGVVQSTLQLKSSLVQLLSGPETDETLAKFGRR